MIADEVKPVSATNNELFRFYRVSAAETKRLKDCVLQERRQDRIFTFVSEDLKHDVHFIISAWEEIQKSDIFLSLGVTRINFWNDNCRGQFRNLQLLSCMIGLLRSTRWRSTTSRNIMGRTSKAILFLLSLVEVTDRSIPSRSVE
ncbi:hypothetical protein PROFUN_15859 [Planoprotostelium fungivorum]|uniref:Uncharacterized protein n=1 Tax=Planoprotostelium fungivorum TaxID=1890364 RepID=A0A2P6MU83_9EUKA|nr:hypothetical protein PROFUN_15859 [Planoprotostelium fungivorum]